MTGVDISDVQVERARQLVPGAVFLRADATEAGFPPGTFDAVVCLYALIHMPLDRQPRLLRDIARWLRPGGWLLATTGQDAWNGHRGELARRRSGHAVEPGRRRQLPDMARPGRPGGHRPAVRARGRQRPRAVLGTAQGRRPRRCADSASIPVRTCGRQPATTEYRHPASSAASAAAAKPVASSSLTSLAGRTSNSHRDPSRNTARKSGTCSRNPPPAVSYRSVNFTALTSPMGQAAACLPWRSQRSLSRADQRTRGAGPCGAERQGAFVGRLCQRA